MKRLMTWIIVLAMIGGLAWWQRQTVVPYLVEKVPASAALLAKVPGLAELAGPKPAETGNAAAEAGAAGGGRRRGGPVAVVVAKAEVKNLPVVVDAVGTAQSFASVAVRPRIDSAVVGVDVAEGAKVKQGQTMFRLDDRATRAQIAQIQAQIARDQAQIEQANLDLKRANDLLAKNAGAVTTRDTAVTALKVAQAALAADQASLDAANITLSYTVITAPVSGRVGAIPVKPGAIVHSADTTAMATVNQIDPILVAFAMPQQRLDGLRAAMAKGPVPVDVSVGTKTLRGTVAFIDNTIDTTTGTIMVKANVPNPDEVLWPGAYVKVDVVLDPGERSVTVPTLALQLGQDTQYLFVVKDGKTAELRKVKVDRAAGTETVIASGLSGGEEVVVDGQLSLVDGAPVSIKPAEAVASAMPANG